MVPGKNVIIAMIVLAACAGCLKKKADRDIEFSSPTKSATATPPAASAQDIFDEFYKEDSGAAKAAKAPKSEPVVRSSPGGKPSFSENGRFVVQVSTLPSRLLADALKEKLSAKGYPCYVAEVRNPTPALQGTFYRVRIGGFAGVSLARSFGENHLAAEGYDFWVDNRSNDNVGLDGSGMGSAGGSYYGTTATTDYQSSSQSSYQSSYQSTPAAEPSPAYESSLPAAPAEAKSREATPPPYPSPSPKSSTQSEWGSSDDW